MDVLAFVISETDFFSVISTFLYVGFSGMLYHSNFFELFTILMYMAEHTVILFTKPPFQYLHVLAVFAWVPSFSFNLVFPSFPSVSIYIFFVCLSTKSSRVLTFNLSVSRSSWRLIISSLDLYRLSTRLSETSSNSSSEMVTSDFYNLFSSSSLLLCSLVSVKKFSIQSSSFGILFFIYLFWLTVDSVGFRLLAIFLHQGNIRESPGWL